MIFTVAGKSRFGVGELVVDESDSVIKVSLCLHIHCDPNRKSINPPITR